MSRLLAQAGGLTYNLPQDNLAAQMGARVVRGGTNASNTSQNLDPLSKLMEDELYQQEGKTKEYYNKIGALQMFAKQAAAAGIDVTSPDYTNPNAVRYHTMYQQALADIYNTRNDLTRLKNFEDKSLTDANLVRRFGENGDPYFANIGETALTGQIAKQAEQVQSEEELKQFLADKQQYLADIQRQISQARDPREREELGATYRQIAAIRPGIGISPYQQASLEQDESQFVRREANEFARASMRAKQDGGDKGEKAFGRLKNIADIFVSQDPTQLVASSGVGEPKFETTLQGTAFTYIDPSNHIRRIPIDLSSNEGFRRSIAAFNAAMNAAPGSEGSGDVSNEALLDLVDKLDDEALTELRMSLRDEGGFADDLTEPVKELMFQSARKGASTDEYKGLVDILSLVQDGVVPESALKKKKLKGEYYLDSIEADFTNGFFRAFGASDDIKINVSDGKGNDETITLDLTDENDLAILKDLIDQNVGYLPADLLDRLPQ